MKQHEWSSCSLARCSTHFVANFGKLSWKGQSTCNWQHKRPQHLLQTGLACYQKHNRPQLERHDTFLDLPHSFEWLLFPHSAPKFQRSLACWWHIQDSQSGPLKYRQCCPECYTNSSTRYRFKGDLVLLFHTGNVVYGVHNESNAKINQLVLLVIVHGAVVDSNHSILTYSPCIHSCNILNRVRIWLGELLHNKQNLLWGTQHLWLVKKWISHHFPEN